jgi:hypothetical protein
MVPVEFGLLGGDQSSVTNPEEYDAQLRWARTLADQPHPRTPKDRLRTLTGFIQVERMTNPIREYGRKPTNRNLIWIADTGSMAR